MEKRKRCEAQRKGINHIAQDGETQKTYIDHSLVILHEQKRRFVSPFGNDGELIERDTHSMGMMEKQKKTQRTEKERAD